jgi:hypothetical protein
MPENKKVDFSAWTQLKIAEAIESILRGTCSRVDVNKDVKVYRCQSVVRVDLKVTEDK